MKKIDTLVSDIQKRLISGEAFDKDTVTAFGTNLAAKLASRLAEAKSAATLRLSNLGTRCDRKLWYTINVPEMAEPLPASARLKFLFGDILEEVLLFLARAAGHTVEQEQATVDVSGIKGHIDAVVDGELVDCKSASSFAFQKFKNHGLAGDDPFGYITQLGGYLHGLSGNDTVRKDRAHFLAVDKQMGHLALDTHDKTGVDYDALVRQKRQMLARPTPPPRAYSDEADGKSGNRKLGMACSYCAFKHHCWPGLRKFSYSRGPVFLTRVERQPDVPEVKSDAPEE